MALGHRSLIIGVLGVGLALAASTSQAQTIAEVLEQGTGCPPAKYDYPEHVQFSVKNLPDKRILIMAGGIDKGDAERLAQFLRTNGPFNEIWLHSPGGDAWEGVPIGKVIRASKIPVRVPDGYICISSCSLAFLGGVIRRVDPGGSYGVHMFYSADSWIGFLKILQKDFRSELPEADRAILASKGHKAEKARVETELARRKEYALRNYMHGIEQNSANLAGEWARYTIEMGISRDFLRDVIFRQGSIKEYTSEQFQDYFEYLVNLGISKGLTREQAIPLATQAFGRNMRTYVCPDSATLRRYNVVNVN